MKWLWRYIVKEEALQRRVNMKVWGKKGEWCINKFIEPYENIVWKTYKQECGSF